MLMMNLSIILNNDKGCPKMSELKSGRTRIMPDICKVYNISRNMI